jgi:hypothetical protein
MKGVITMLKRIMFNYYWAKGERAMKNGDHVLADKCKVKLNNIRNRK